MDSNNSATKKRNTEDTTLSVDVIPTKKPKHEPIGGPSERETLTAMNNFYRTKDRSYSEMYHYLAESQRSGVELTSTLKANNVFHLRRLCALIAMLKWLGYALKAADTIVGVLPLDQKTMFTSDPEVKDIWTIIYVEHPEADSDWLQECASRRKSVRFLAWEAPPPPAFIAQAQMPNNNRREISEFVTALCMRCRRHASLWNNTSIWIKTFGKHLSDETGQIAAFAVFSDDPTLASQLEKSPNKFACYAVSRTLDETVRAMNACVQSKKPVDQTWTLIAMSIDAALFMETDGGFYGMAQQLFQVAVLCPDPTLFGKVAQLSPRLGQILGVASIVAPIVGAGDEKNFITLAKTAQIDSRELWNAFAASIKSSDDKHVKMLTAFVDARKQWSIDNRELITKTLQARALVQLMCTFAKLIALKTGKKIDLSLAESTFDAVTQCAKQQETTASGATLCLVCGDPAEYLLPCGHLIGCEKCMDKLSDPNNTGMAQCPNCRVQTDKKNGNWKIKLFR